MKISASWRRRFCLRLPTALAVVATVLTATSAGAESNASALLLQDHPLANSIWHTGKGTRVAEADLVEAARRANWVLLGEKHDNAAHHQIQARLVAALGEAGRRPGVVWEMAGPDQAEAFAKAELDGVADLGTALRWEERGWPAWSIYQPIAEAALTHGMPMSPGNPSVETTRAIGRGGTLTPEQEARLRWSVGYDEEQLSDLTAQLNVSHCGALPDAAMAPMTEVQRLRDAWMAASLREADQGSGAVLIAGSQHVREDRGVPWVLDEPVFSLALIEVDRTLTRAEDYPSFDPALFDYVWFTARVDEDDPCEKFFGKAHGENG